MGNAAERLDPAPRLHGERYLRPRSDRLARFIAEDLAYLDFAETMRWYRSLVPHMDNADRALLGCNDRYFLLTGLLGRKDALHPWLFNRCREVEADPDGHLDLWARYHYKSTICTFAGIIQEVVRDPETTACILSCTNAIAAPFLGQIQREFENNEDLKRVYPDVLWQDPIRESPRWSRKDGIVLKRRSNPKEATVEAHGLIDGMPTGKHYRLLVYDDLITETLVRNPDIIKKVTECWELSDNLGTIAETRKWHLGTRYSYADSYGVILERGTLKERKYPATDDGTLDGTPVLLSHKRWEEVKDAQRGTVSAQMLQEPRAGNEQVFKPGWLKSYDVRPTMMNVYIMVDPSKGRGKRSDRTAIAVVGVDVAGNRYLLDGIRHRMPLSERWAHLKRLYLKWSTAIGVQVVIVGYERYGQQTEDEVIREWMMRDGLSFKLVEMNWPREGQHSKSDRISRLEPDIRRGRFYLPAVVYHPDIGGQQGLAYWSVWTQAQHDAAAARGEQPSHHVDQIVYRPYHGPTKQQVTCQKTNQSYRIVTAIRAVDEEKHLYDLTRAFIEEALFFPFGNKDDLVDATSRLYDLEPKPAVPFESEQAEQAVYVDS